MTLMKIISLGVSMAFTAWVAIMSGIGQAALAVIFVAIEATIPGDQLEFLFEYYAFVEFFIPLEFALGLEAAFLVNTGLMMLLKAPKEILPMT